MNDLVIIASLLFANLLASVGASVVGFTVYRALMREAAFRRKVNEKVDSFPEEDLNVRTK